MRPFPRKCVTCREVAVEPAVLPSYTVPMEHDGTVYDVTVPDLHTPRCANCGEVMLDDDAIDRLYHALREAAGLLMPEAIRAGRESLGLTQAQMASLLQAGPATVDRWETGGQIQQRAMDLLLRAFFQVPEFRRFLGCAGEASAPPWPIAEARMMAEVVPAK